jgi:hypothetical protein
LLLNCTLIPFARQSKHDDGWIVVAARQRFPDRGQPAPGSGGHALAAAGWRL